MRTAENAVPASSQVGVNKSVMGVLWKIFRYVLRLMPARLGRMFYLISIYEHLVDAQLFRKVNHQELNAILGLVTVDETIDIPATVYPVIWEHGEISSMLKDAGIYDRNAPYDNMDTCFEDFCTQIASKAPSCLRYAAPDVMANDLLTLFHHFSKDKVAPA